MSPDPDNAGATDDAPQTWNAYSYVINNPLNATDPDGLDWVYLSSDEKSASVKPGDCKSDTDEGIYVNGTVNSLSLTVSDQGDILNINYHPYDSGSDILDPQNLGESASGLSAAVYNFAPGAPGLNPRSQTPALGAAGALTGEAVCIFAEPCGATELTVAGVVALGFVATVGTLKCAPAYRMPKVRLTEQKLVVIDTPI